MAREVIGSYCICNTASINVYEFDIGGVDERVLVGINDEEPEWVDIVGVFDNDNDEYIQGFNFKGFGFIPFCEVVRV